MDDWGGGGEGRGRRAAGKLKFEPHMGVGGSSSSS